MDDILKEFDMNLRDLQNFTYKTMKRYFDFYVITFGTFIEFILILLNYIYFEFSHIMTVTVTYCLKFLEDVMFR